MRGILGPIVALLVAASTLSAGRLARAEEASSDEGDEGSARHERGSRGGSPVHGELTMGFITGGRRYDALSFAHESGGEGIEGAGGLVQPFVEPPFDGVLAFGLRYDVRLVVSYVRMTAGVDIPFPAYDAQGTAAGREVGGEERQIVVQAIRPWELRFGIGGEYPLGIVAPYVDLLGTVCWVDADLAVDGELTRYRATSFGFAARAGARVHVRPWFFVAASGEVGIVGSVFWGAELSVGFALG